MRKKKNFLNINYRKKKLRLLKALIYVSFFILQHTVVYGSNLDSLKDEYILKLRSNLLRLNKEQLKNRLKKNKLLLLPSVNVGYNFIQQTPTASLTFNFQRYFNNKIQKEILKTNNDRYLLNKELYINKIDENLTNTINSYHQRKELYSQKKENQKLKETIYFIKKAEYQNNEINLIEWVQIQANKNNSELSLKRDSTELARIKSNILKKLRDELGK